jgi:hypothetical protein
MIEWSSLPWGIIATVLIAIITGVFGFIVGLFIHRLRKFIEKLNDVKDRLGRNSETLDNVYQLLANGREAQPPPGNTTDVVPPNSESAGGTAETGESNNDVPTAKEIVYNMDETLDLDVGILMKGPNKEKTVTIRSPTGYRFKRDLENDDAMKKTYADLQQSGTNLFSTFFNIEAGQNEAEIVLHSINTRKQADWLEKAIKSFDNQDAMVEEELA